MRKSLFTALVVAAGVASQAGAATPSAIHITDSTRTIPTTKLGLLNISLNNVFQAYDKPVGSSTWGIQINPPRAITPSRTWDNRSYDYLANCLGIVTYRSNTKQVNNATIITAINAAMSPRPSYMGTVPNGLFNKATDAFGLPNAYIGAFNPATAKIVVVNYDNLQQLPPYPPTVDNHYAPIPPNVFNAPYNWAGLPDSTLANGAELTLVWPAQNYIAWGKPDPAAAAQWIGARVFVLDPKNVNPLLRCFDVTPFFALEESYCEFCWDTMDRVTDGTINRGTTVSDPPCAVALISCGVKGSGITKIYWTVKFNNVSSAWPRNPNLQLNWYYSFVMGFDPTGTYYTFGTELNDLNVPYSLTTLPLAFTLNGIATYSWSFKKLSDNYSWPMGTLSMTSSGHGYSPMCGVFSGPVSMVEYDKANALFGGVWCVAP